MSKTDQAHSQFTLQC